MGIDFGEMRREYFFSTYRLRPGALLRLRASTCTLFSFFPTLPGHDLLLDVLSADDTNNEDVVA
jgi:hypothetical protein